MADKTTITKILAVGAKYTDENNTEKIAYVKIPNPKNSITESDIKTRSADLFNNILNDPLGASMTAAQIETAYTEETTKVELDLT